ncbi:MAG: hypothetical protein Q9193_001528, partial [Seirophora villosa]
ARQHDPALGLLGQRRHGRVPLVRSHGPVDARVPPSVLPQLVLDDVQERGPLAEDDDLAPGLLPRSLEDLDQRLDFAARRVDVDVTRRALAQVYRGADEGVDFQGFGAAHGTAVLGLDDFFDAVVAERVGACGDDGLVEGFETDGAIFVGLDADLKHVL